MSLFFEKLFLDLVDPFLIWFPLLTEGAVVILETVVIFYLMERRLARAFVASLCANLLTGVLSTVYLFFPLELGAARATIGEDVFTMQPSALILILAFGLCVNILVEAGVLKLFYRTRSTGRIFEVSTVMNVISYSIIIFNFLLVSYS
jgi:hypothetical protein